MSKVHIKTSEHVFIAGRTGSGKTFLARKYLSGYKNVVCLDTKGTTNWPEVEKKELTVVKNLVDLSMVETPKIIYRPVWEELNDDYYNEFFRWVYRRRNTIVWIDEVMSICPNPHKIPSYYKAVLTRGRELNTAAWSLTQRPSGIPAITVSESTHIMVFDLNMPQDREKMADISGCEEFEEKPGKYNFWYFNTTGEKATLARLKVR